MKLAEWVNAKKELPSFQKLILPAYAGGQVNERKATLLLATIIEYVESLPLLLSQISVNLSPHAVRKDKAHFQLLTPDAFSNPEYVYYALKSTLAIFLAYITYNLLDWPGIRTCMITCFFVSLGSFGESALKMALRLTGALIGGGLGLATVVFIMPHITTIVGLSIVSAVIAFIAAWVATSSERLSYAGIQIALAFFMCILVGYGPTTDLTEGRDRVVGVLLGILIVFLVFTFIRPASAVAHARLLVAAALNQLSRIFVTTPVASSEIQSQNNTLFFDFSAAISQARRLVSLDVLEPLRLRQGIVTVDNALIGAVQAVYGPLIILSEHPFLKPAPDVSNKSFCDYYTLLSAWLFNLSVQLKESKFEMSPPPEMDQVIQTLKNEIIRSPTPIWITACIDWHLTLNERLYQLDSLIRKSIDRTDIPLNQAIREPM